MTHCGDEQKPILPVNREILGFGGNMTLDVEQELIRIHLRTDRRYQAKKLDVRAFQHHIEIHSEGRLLHCFSLYQPVDPSSLSVIRNGCSVKLTLSIKQASGHPKPVRHGSDERSESCLEHPRARASSLETGEGQSV